MIDLDAAPLGAKLAQHLRKEILSGQLVGDQHLVEAQIAEKFGVSRGPVRDALRELERDGFVYSARQGSRVAAVTAADIEELYSIRFMVECMAIDIADLEAIDWDALQAICDGLANAAERGDQAQFSRYDLAFHRFFCDAAGGKRLQAIWNLVEPTLTALLEINPHPSDDLKASAAEHVEILSLLRSGSPEWRDLLQQHLAGARARLSVPRVS